MSQQPQESIVDRFIDWWKRLFGPPTAEGTATTSSTDQVQRERTIAGSDASSSATGVSAAGAQSADANKHVPAPTEEPGFAPVDNSGDIDTTSSPSDIPGSDDDGGTAATFDATQAGRTAASGANQAAISSSQQLETETDILRQTSEDVGHSPLFMDPEDDPAHTALESKDERESSEWVENEDVPASTAASSTTDGEGDKGDESEVSESTESFARESPENDESHWGQGTIDQPGSHDQASQDTGATPSPESATGEDMSIPPDKLDEDGFSSTSAAPDVDADFDAGAVATAVDFGTPLGDDEAVVSTSGDEQSSTGESGIGTDDSGANADFSTSVTDAGTRGDEPTQRDLSGGGTGEGVAPARSASMTAGTSPGSGSSGQRSSGKQAPEGAVGGDGSNVCPAAFPIKGNANSHIYHMPGESSYDATVAEWCFANEDAAKAAGYRARKR